MPGTSCPHVLSDFTGDVWKTLREGKRWAVCGFKRVCRTVAAPGTGLPPPQRRRAQELPDEQNALRDGPQWPPHLFPTATLGHSSGTSLSPLGLASLALCVRVYVVIKSQWLNTSALFTPVESTMRVSLRWIPIGSGCSPTWHLCISTHVYNHNGHGHRKSLENSPWLFSASGCRRHPPPPPARRFHWPSASQD